MNFTEIATVLLQFVQLLRSGNVEQCEEEFGKLPVANTNWLQESRTSNHQQVNLEYYKKCLSLII